MAIEKDIIINVKEKGIDELQSKVLKLDTSLENLDDTNKNLSKTMDGTQQSVLDNGGAMGLLNDATGGLAMTVKDAVEASALFAKQSKIGMAVQKAYTLVMGSSTGAMKVFKLALIGTGIGAIVVGIGLLIANFDKVKKAVMNLIPGLSLVGDFFGKIVNAVTDFIGVTSDATRELKKLSEATEQMLTDNKNLLANFGDQLSDFQKKQVDIANSLGERIKEINESEILSLEEKNKQIKLAQERAKRDLLKNIDDTNTEVAKKRQEERDKINEEKQKEKQAELDRIAYEKANPRKEVIAIGTTIINPEEEILAKKLIDDQKILADRVTEDAIAAYRKEIREEDAAATKLLEEQKRDAKFAIANQTMNIIGMLAKKGSKLAKGVAVAQAMMNTYQGITAALAAPTMVPDPLGFALKIANAAAVGVTGLLNVKKIMSTDESGKSVSGGGSVDVGSAPSAPSFNLVQGTGSNQIAQGLQKSNQPIKAYVVSSDVSTGQEMDRKIIAGASL